MPYATHSLETPVKPFIFIFPLLKKIQINPSSRTKWSPMQGGISRPLPLCCGVPRCLFAKSLLHSAAGTNPRPPRTPELCKKGLELDRGLGCFVLLLSQLGFRNWQNWAVRTRPGCKLGLPVGGPCRSRKGERIRSPSLPSRASGRGTPLPGTHPAARPKGVPGEPQPARSPGFHWGGPGQRQDGGCQCLKEPLDPPGAPSPWNITISIPGLAAGSPPPLPFFFFKGSFHPSTHPLPPPPASPHRRVWLIWFLPNN